MIFHTRIPVTFFSGLGPPWNQGARIPTLLSSGGHRKRGFFYMYFCAGTGGYFCLRAWFLLVLLFPRYPFNASDEEGKRKTMAFFLGGGGVVFSLTRFTYIHLLYCFC